MSDFRRFCIGAFIGIGLEAAAINHGLAEPKMPVADALLIAAFTLGFAVVALLGRRA